MYEKIPKVTIIKNKKYEITPTEDSNYKITKHKTTPINNNNYKK